MTGRKLKIGTEEVDIVPGFLNDIPVDGETNNQKRKRKRNEFRFASGGMPDNPKRMPLQLADNITQGDVSGKLYPGRVSFADMRALARYSTVVRAIIIMRSQQIAKLPIKIIPKSKEPTLQTSILKYTYYDLENIPAFDDSDVAFLRDIFDRIDENGFIYDKRKKFNELKMQGEFSPKELAAIEHLQEKHDAFYKKRAGDIKKIEKILSRPDPYFTETPTWNSLVNKILEDVLVLDRGTLVKIRDEDGNIQGLMPVDGACYSDDTEVLTKDGWKLFKDVDIEKDLFATRSPSGKFEWQSAFYRHDVTYTGEMINFTSRTTDLLVSPNHRMLLETNEASLKKGRKFKSFVVTAQEAESMKSGDYGIPRTSVWTGNPLGRKTFGKVSFSGEDFAAFLGMYIAEGSTYNNKHIRISQKEGTKGWGPFKSLLVRLFGRVYEDSSGFVVTNTELVSYLKVLGRSWEKYIPKEVLDATPEELSIFWKFYTLGDGWYEGGRERAKTVSKRLADDLMELLQKTGYSGSISVVPYHEPNSYIGGRLIGEVNGIREAYVVSKLTTKATSYSTKRVQYSGTIHCVSVPNEILYVRRNGHAAWCGNTIKPVVNEFGYLDDEKSYVQLVQGVPKRYLSKNDIIIVTMNPVTDVRYFGYGISPMETLYTAVLSDLFIDKGNLDYYRKGGSIPEGMIAIEPPANKEGIINQIDQEQLDAIQRQLQSILMGDFTQIPIVSGGKISWIDFKGKRRDMQFKELAEYLVRKICSVYQVSPQDVGILEGMKTSDGQVQADMTRSKGLQTIMTVLSEFITESVIQEIRPEDDLKLWFEEPEEREADKNWGTQARLQAGVYSVNEVRAKEGLPPVAWGNTPLSNGNTKNWSPTDTSTGGEGLPGQGTPGMGELPPLPGISPFPSGSSAPAPQGTPPAPPVMKSVFDLAEQVQRDHLKGVNLDPIVNMYLKDVRIREEEDDELDEILTYKSGEEVRSPIDSYTRLLKSFSPISEIDVLNDEEELILFSRIDGDRIVVDDKGTEPMLRTIARSIAQHEDEVPALEWALLDSLDSGTSEKLRKFYYDNIQRVPSNEIRKVRSKYLT